jgi:hypothetical protein
MSPKESNNYSAQWYRIEKNINSVHPDVECTYSVFANSGKKYFQIDTYGTEQRQVKHQPSQKIQFGKDFAVQLIDILKKEFNL